MSSICINQNCHTLPINQLLPFLEDLIHLIVKQSSGAGKDGRRW